MIATLYKPGFISDHFTVAEIACRCCGSYNRAAAHVLCQELEKVRLVSGPIVIISGHRCLASNTRIGGAKQSLHMQTMAVDIQVMADSQRFRLVQQFVQCGWLGIGVGNRMVHADLRHMVFLNPPAVMWAYPHEE